MSRLIDVDALMPKLKFIRESEHQIYGKESWGFASKCITAIEDAPTIEPERKKGKWVIDGHHIKCNQCGELMCNTDREGDKIPTNFCPNCGSDMRGDQDE